MDASRPGTAGVAPAENERGDAGRQHLIAAGGILGALAASSCCIVPLILFSLGIGGAWIGNLTALGKSSLRASANLCRFMRLRHAAKLVNQ